MPKLDFNVPYLTATGDTVRRPKVHATKMAIGPNGTPAPVYVLDEDKNVVLEDVMVKDLLVQVLDAPYPGDEAVAGAEKVKRGKLARKVSDKTKGSLKNYSIDELALIQTLAARSGSTQLVTQLDDIVNATGEEKSGEANAA